MPGWYCSWFQIHNDLLSNSYLPHMNPYWPSCEPILAFAYTLSILTSILCNHQKIPIGPRHGPTRNWMKLSQNGQYHSGIGKQLSKLCYQRSLPWLPRKSLFAKFGQNSLMNLLNLAPFLAEISSIINKNITKPFYFLNNSMFCKYKFRVKRVINTFDLNCYHHKW